MFLLLKISFGREISDIIAFSFVMFCFFILNRCLFASFLTIALQTKLVYLTHILEVLTKDLMEQSSNVQPKLLLRRTESVVEKLLTNWMSVCLSGFLRVWVHLFTASHTKSNILTDFFHKECYWDLYKALFNALLLV